ncbi:uncharacterized protein Bfra_011595 [Botrytis fragariae]|uniref:Uncharacterized protein n=1 Tax=Botrytis fragariae TaxID=1964551 RepID=A0A8H6AKN3_9HELO|nr:uncharacterized protein Bfra_011595 [Botrytis fragariae]KAF5869053.1 hypothetical protein Bfra_011595 [Botrytis fragariae]
MLHWMTDCGNTHESELDTKRLCQAAVPRQILNMTTIIKSSYSGLLHSLTWKWPSETSSEIASSNAEIAGSQTPDY